VNKAPHRDVRRIKRKRRKRRKDGSGRRKKNKIT
jgi:hypothetical protein